MRKLDLKIFAPAKLVSHRQATFVIDKRRVYTTIETWNLEKYDMVKCSSQFYFAICFLAIASAADPACLERQVS